MPLIETKLIYYASQHPCNEKLSWMIGTWMNNHLVSANNCH